MELNELRTFVHLYETRSVTATATLLDVTQPSVSYTLAKLRRHFGDELFERGRGGLVATGTAGDLYEPLRAALEELERAVRAPQEFRPAEAQRTFRATMSELAQLTFVPLLAPRLAALAPGCSLHAGHLDAGTAAEALARGRVDLVISSVLLPEETLDRRPFMRVGYAALVAEDHPRVSGRRLSAAQLRAERLVIVRGTAGHEGPLRMVEQRGLGDRVEVELSDFGAVPYVVAAGDLVGVVPRHIGDVFAARHPVRVVDLPWTVAPIDVAAYTRRGPSAAQAWFRDLVVETLSAQRLA